MEDYQTKLHAILKCAKQAAIAYYDLTGKPLGITGEIGEYEAARLLGLTLAAARTPGYDATDQAGCRYQIKTRALSKAARQRSQQIGGIKSNEEWDAVLFVLLDEHFQTEEIWKAEREQVVLALMKPGSKARNERGALPISKFRKIGRRVWPRPSNQLSGKPYMLES